MEEIEYILKGESILGLSCFFVEMDKMNYFYKDS